MCKGLTAPVHASYYIFEPVPTFSFFVLILFVAGSFKKLACWIVGSDLSSLFISAVFF